MHSKHISAAAREHMGKVKSVACSLCGAPPPSQAHHIKQGLHFATVSLCQPCHDNWHGTKTLWRIAKKDELMALDTTLQRVAAL